MFHDPKNTWFTKYIFILVCTVLSGCSTLSGTKKDQGNTQLVEFLVLTTPLINPDVLDRASPVRLDVFQLTEKSTFVYDTYLDLIDEDDNLNDAVLSKSEHILTPDSITSIPLGLEKDTNYLGLTTGYRDIEEVSWKLVLHKQPPKWGSRNSYLYLKVDESGIFQLSKKQMQSELKEYARRHPDDETVSKNGDYKKPKYDYSKGIFNNE